MKALKMAVALACAVASTAAIPSAANAMAAGDTICFYRGYVVIDGYAYPVYQCYPKVIEPA